MGHETMLQCQDIERTREICACKIQAAADQKRPAINRIQSESGRERQKAAALHARLYDRPVPVNDAEMLALNKRRQVLLAMIAITATACLAGSILTLYLFGFGLFVMLFGALGITCIPVAIGHFFYEQILARHRMLQSLLVVASVAICFIGLFELGQMRRHMVRKATASTAPVPYVDGDPGNPPAVPASTSPEDSESGIREGLSDASFLITFAAEFILGFLVARYTSLREIMDYVAWHTLKLTTEVIADLEHAAAEILASLEIAKKQCIAGILRADNGLRKRRPPSYHGSTAAMVGLFALVLAIPSRAQPVDHYDAILVDASKSITRSANNDLFHEYLYSTKRILLHEPPNSRVLVTVIRTDSFGASQDLVKGWTPDARGIFTDNLNRARHELAECFERQSSQVAPREAGTDIFGALWHVKTFFESNPDIESSASQTIWIFSDMMNETPEFPMPKLLSLGPEQMFERAKANGLVVPLKGYKVYVQGASAAGLTAQRWLILKTFWTMYFATAGAELVIYSPGTNAER
jgi:hypothetical protein